MYTAYYSSPVGLLKLQCSDKHIKTVNFCDAEAALQNDEHKLLEACAEELDEYFAGKRKQFTLPLNQDGTEFQAKVWDLLLKISYGKTISCRHTSVDRAGSATSCAFRSGMPYGSRSRRIERAARSGQRHRPPGAPRAAQALVLST